MEIDIGVSEEDRMSIADGFFARCRIIGVLYFLKI